MERLDLRRRLAEMYSSRLARGAFILSVLTFAGYLMGLVRDRMFFRTYGLGPELDAYNAAFVLPELALDVLVASGLVAPFVPLFTTLRTETIESAKAFGQTILTLAVARRPLTGRQTLQRLLDRDLLRPAHAAFSSKAWTLERAARTCK